MGKKKSDLDLGKFGKLEIVSIKKLKPWSKNPKGHNIDAIVKSVELYGPRQPILVQAKTMRIIAGHGRLEAYKKLGIKQIPIVIWECTDEQADAYTIADNQLTISGGWNEDILAEIVEGMDSNYLDTLGFEDDYLDKLLNIEVTEITEDDVPEDVDTVCQPGQLWKLGDHKLLCGDATSKEDVSKLMGGGSADMVFTDPPWNVEIGQQSNPKWRQRTGLMNDGLTDTDFENFINNFCKLMSTNVKGDIYVVMGSGNWPVIDAAIRSSGFHWSATIIWNKSIHVIGRSNYHRKYEPIWYGWKGKSSYNGSRKENDVWDIDKPAASPEHPTMKPIQLMVKAINNSSRKGQIVLDVFGGSGSTLIACEQTGRHCRMLELDGHYCDVIIKRWENLTGKIAEMI